MLRRVGGKGKDEEPIFTPIFQRNFYSRTINGIGW